MENKFNFEAIQKKAEEMKVDLPKIVANKAQRYFNESFRKAAWGDKAWEQPQRKISGTKAFKYAKPPAQSSKPILVNTGFLSKAVKNSLRHANWNEIMWEVYCKYAQVHNEGAQGTVYVKAHTSHRYKKVKIQHKGKSYSGKRPGDLFPVKGYSRKQNIPQRQFIGMNKELNEQLEKVIQREVNKLFK